MAWVRKFINEEQMTWYLLLNRMLADAKRPSPKDHLKLGHNEWIISGQKLLERNEYWGHTF